MNRKTAEKIMTALAGAALLSIAGTGLAVYAAGDNPPADGPYFERGPGHGDPGFMPPDPLGLGIGHGALHRLADKLDLTQEQRDTIKGYFEAARPGMKSLREEARANAELLHNTKPDDPNYSNVVAQASQKAGALASRMVTDGSQLRAQIWQVLTPQQRTKMDELVTEFKTHARERWQNRKPPMPAKEGEPDAA